MPEDCKSPDECDFCFLIPQGEEGSCGDTSCYTECAKYEKCVRGCVPFPPPSPPPLEPPGARRLYTHALPARC